MSMNNHDIQSLRKGEGRFKDDDRYNFYPCAFCKKDVEENDFFHYDDDQDAGWCSEKCLLAAEARGIIQMESQMEDEGND